MRLLLLALYAVMVCAPVLATAESKYEEYVDPKLLNEACPIPDKYDLVNDYWGSAFLSISKIIEMRDKLRALERENGTQIVILIVPSTGKEGVCHYAERVFEKWDIGNNGQANGVLFLHDALAGHYCIRTGAGIAGALPDSRLYKVMREKIDPIWRDSKNWDNRGNAIETAVDAMIKVARGEETEKTYYDYDKINPTHVGMALRWEQLIGKTDRKLNRDTVGIALLVFGGLAYVGVLFWKHRRNKRRGDRA